MLTPQLVDVIKRSTSAISEINHTENLNWMWIMMFILPLSTAFCEQNVIGNIILSVKWLYQINIALCRWFSTHNGLTYVCVTDGYGGERISVSAYTTTKSWTSRRPQHTPLWLSIFYFRVILVSSLLQFRKVCTGFHILYALFVLSQMGNSVLFMTMVI